jgi:hypothetical protein
MLSELAGEMADHGLRTLMRVIMKVREIQRKAIAPLMAGGK